MKIRRYPWGIRGNGWAVYAGTYCGERWYRISSWKAYSKPLIKKLQWDKGFQVGPFLFWKEG